MAGKVESEPVRFEDAITKCGLGKFNYIVMFLAGSLMACAFIELSSVNLVLSIAECDLPMTSREKGILSAIGYAGVILSSFLWGFLADTKGRRKTLIPTLLAAFTATVVSSLVNNFWLLVFLRFWNGFFISCASATTFAFLGEFHDAKNRGRILMRTSVIYAVMSMLMPTFGILTLNQEWTLDLDVLGVTYKPWRLFLLVCGLPGLMCAGILYFFVPESPKFTFSQGDEEGTLKILQQMYRVNTGADSLTYEVKSLVKDEEFDNSEKKGVNFFKFMWMQSVPLFRGMHLRNLLTASFINFSCCLSSNGFMTFLPEILNKISLWIENSDQPATVCEMFYAKGLVESVVDVANETACYQKLEISTLVHFYEIMVVFGVCWVIMSLLINRIGKLLILLFILITCGIAASLLGLLKAPVILPYIYVYMFSSGCIMSVVNASTAELFPTKMRAMAICISMMVGRLGSGGGSIIIGFLIDKYCSWTFAMPVIVCFISAVLSFTIPNISKRQK